jgi:hypothetical protein
MLWQFAQLLCDHWHIATVTSQCANEIEADLKKNPPDLEIWVCCCTDRSFETGDLLNGKNGSRPLA